MFLVGAVIGGLTTGWLYNAALWIPVLTLSFTLWRCWQSGMPVPAKPDAYPQSAIGGGDSQAPS